MPSGPLEINGWTLGDTPSWVPASAVTYCKKMFEGRELTSDADGVKGIVWRANLCRRLLTDPDMKVVWEMMRATREIQLSFGYDDPDRSVDLLLCILHAATALDGPWEGKTPRQRKNALKKIEEQAKVLAEALRESPLESIPPVDRMRLEAPGCEQWPVESPAVNMHQALTALSGYAAALQNERPLITKTKGPKALQRYLIRSLSQYFISWMGYDWDLDKSIAAICRVTLQDEDIDSETVRKAVVRPFTDPQSDPEGPPESSA